MSDPNEDWLREEFSVGRDPLPHVNTISSLLNAAGVTRDFGLSKSGWETLDAELSVMLEAFPESSILWFWRGFSHYFADHARLGIWEPLPRFEEIEADLDRAIELDPHNASAVLILCHLYMREAYRNAMLARLPAAGIDSVEALYARIEAEDNVPADIVELLYAEFKEDEAPDYAEAKRVWEEASHSIGMHWNAVPSWFFYESEFDGETHWTLSDYDGWFGVLWELVDVFGKEEGAWIIAAAVAAVEKTEILDIEIRVESLKWALDAGIQEPTYHVLAKLYLLRAELKASSKADATPRNVDFEITELEEAVSYVQMSSRVFGTDFPNSEMIRSRFAGFLLDWLAATPEAHAEPVVARLVENSFQVVLTGEYGETDEALRLVHFMGQRYLENGELVRAEDSLRRAFSHARSEEAAVDLAAALRDLQREDEAIDVLKSVRSPTRSLRQLLKQNLQWRDERGRILKRELLGDDAARGQKEILSQLEAMRSEMGSSFLSVDANVLDLKSSFERHMDDFRNASGPEKAAELIARQIALRNGWVSELVLDLGFVLSTAPAWYRDQIVYAEALYDHLTKEERADFTPVIILWGKLVENGLQEGLLKPFGKWLEDRGHLQPITVGPKGNQRTLYHYDSKVENDSGDWVSQLLRFTSADMLLLAAIDDPDDHPFATYASERELPLGKWLKRENMPTRLTKIREARNDAAHEKRVFSREDADEIRKQLRKNQVLKNVCALLRSDPKGNDSTA